MQKLTKVWMAVICSGVVSSACGGQRERAPDVSSSPSALAATSSRPTRPSVCFAQDPAVAWMRGNAGASIPGASRKLATGFTLCSDAAGMASGVDNYYWVGQGVPGDFSLSAALTVLDAGQASLVFAPHQGAITGARLRLSIAKARKGFQLTAASRAEDGAGETVLASKSVSKLPVTFGIKRVDTLLQLLVDTGTGLKVFASVQADSGGLAHAGLAMLTQASSAPGTFAQASFERVALDVSQVQAKPECAEGFLATTGAPLRILGKNLSQVRAVTIGGQPAPIKSRAADQLVVTVPTVEGTATTVMLRTATQERYLPAALAIERPARTAPSLSLLVDANGDRVVELRDGDEAYFEGLDLPAAGTASLWLGSTAATIQADSTSRRLHFRVGEVKANEAGCPRLFVESGSTADGARFGDTYGVRESVAPHLCPTLVASATTTIAPPAAGREGTVTFSVPSSLAGGERLSILWSATASMKASRGSRFLEVDVPRLSLGTAQDRYRETLGALAKVVAERINGGGEGPECECEVKVTADAVAGTLVLAPCVTLPVDPVDPEPAIPGLPTELEPNKSIWSLLDLQIPNLPGPPNCNEVTPQNDPRRYSWCTFMRMVLETNGVPHFESLTPLNQVAAQNDATPVGVDNPMLRAIADKTTLVEPGMASRYVSLGYATPCSFAARAHYCYTTFNSHWMPRFKTEDRMMKLFWAVASELGDGVDKNMLYTYQAPDGPLRYLVGMHIAVARFDEFGFVAPTDKGYFRWMTLWVPNVGNATQRYNQNCGANLGHNFDMPEALQGTRWGQFVMCSEVDGFTKCGNPWGPHDECNVNAVPGCATCHAAGGKVAGDDSMGLAAGWLFLPTYQAPAINTCLAAIESGQEDHSGDMMCEWSDVDSDPFLN